MPQQRRIAFAQRHDALGRAVAQEIRLFDAVDVGIVQDFALGVQPHQLLVRPRAEMQEQFPRESGGEIPIRWVVFALGGGRLRWYGTGEEVVEQADGVMPFEWDAFEGEPAVVGGNTGVDEEGGEEGEESGEQEGQVR